MEADAPPPTILLIEEDETEAKLMSLLFSRVGWNFEIVSDDARGLEQLAESSFDLVVTDCSEPALSDFLRAVRQQDPNQAVVVIVGAEGRREALKLLDKGAIDIFSKPLEAAA